MKSTKDKLIEKIKEDTGFVIPPKATLYKPKSRRDEYIGDVLKWYWIIDGKWVGSMKSISEILKTPKIIGKFYKRIYKYYYELY